MSNRLVRGIGRVIFWRYRRGSWQYDIVCTVILLFIFLTPKSVFEGAFFERAMDHHPSVVTRQPLKERHLFGTIPDKESELNSFLRN